MKEVSRSERRSPVFIGGAPRSGTTLLRTMLDTHSQIASGPELHLAAALARPHRAGRWQQLEKELRGYPWWTSIALPKPPRNLASRRRLAEQLMAAYLARTGKPRWADKSPSNVFHVELLRELFPEARFILCVRDGRDAVCSLLATQWYRPRLVPRHLAAMLQWVVAARATRRGAERLGSQCLDVRYEDLVRDPERTLRRVLEFLGEPWEARVLEFHRHPHDWTAGGQRIDSPVFSSSIGRWQRDMPRWQARLFRLIAGRTLPALGYSWDDARPAGHGC